MCFQPDEKQPRSYQISERRYKDPLRYRSVSLPPLLTKIWERIIYDQLVRHVSSALCPEQHGFPAHHALVTYLFSLFVHEKLFGKDTRRLQFIYIFRSPLKVSITYFWSINWKTHTNWQTQHYKGSSRISPTIAKGSYSRENPLSGSKSARGCRKVLLLPPAFCSLHQQFSGWNKTWLLYADDANIVAKPNTHLIDGQRLQEDLNHLQERFVRWKLKLNPSKCRNIALNLSRAPVHTTYHIGNTILELVQENRDFDVIIGSNLSFLSHVHTIVRQVNKAIGLMIHLFQGGLWETKLSSKVLFTM